MRGGQLDRAREVLEGLLREKNEGTAGCSNLPMPMWRWGKIAKPSRFFETLKRRMFADKKQNEFATQMDGVGAKHPQSQGDSGILGGSFTTS